MVNNNSASYLAILTVMNAIGSKYIVNEASEHCDTLFSNMATKFVIIFCMIDLTLRDWRYSLKLAILFSLILWYLKQSDEAAEAKEHDRH
jgi:hypothetical protein